VLTAAVYDLPTWASVLRTGLALLPLASLAVLVVLWATRDRRALPGRGPRVTRDRPLRR
jgi:hypothetical protein